MTLEAIHRQTKIPRPRYRVLKTPASRPNAVSDGLYRDRPKKPCLIWNTERRYAAPVEVTESSPKEAAIVAVGADSDDPG